MDYKGVMSETDFSDCHFQN